LKKFVIILSSITFFTALSLTFLNVTWRMQRLVAPYIPAATFGMSNSEFYVWLSILMGVSLGAIVGIKLAK